MTRQPQQHPSCCRATLEQVLEAANWAPTHGKTEPWRFTVLSPEGLDQLVAVSLSVSGLLHLQWTQQQSKPALKGVDPQEVDPFIGRLPIWCCQI